MTFIKPVHPLHKRIRTLEKQVLRLYNNYYANNVRRHEAYKKRTKTIEAWCKRLAEIDSDQLRKLGRIVDGIKKGRHVMTLTLQQRNLLNQILAGRHNPKKIKEGK